MASREELQVLWPQIYIGQPVNDQWVKNFTGKPWSDVVQWTRDDKSRQGVVESLQKRPATPEEVDVIHQLKFKDPAPKTTIDYYKGKPIDDVLQAFQKMADK